MTTDTSASLDLDAIRYRLTEATPGPWGVGNGTHIVRGLEVTGRGSFTCIQSVAEIDDEDDRLDWCRDEAVETDPQADAAFIAHAGRTSPPCSPRSTVSAPSSTPSTPCTPTPPPVSAPPATGYTTAATPTTASLTGPAPRCAPWVWRTSRRLRRGWPGDRR